MRVNRKRVALLIESSRAYGRGLLRGIARYVQTHRGWSVYMQLRSPEDPPPPWLEGWTGDGIIARVESRSMERAILAAGIPAVDVRGCLDLPIPLVETDERSTCRLAFHHLTECGFRRLAFCGFEGANYSERRARYFGELVSEAGLALECFQSPLPDRERNLLLSAREQAAVAREGELKEWLRALPKPVGLFACNDVCGQQVLNACRDLDIAVPEEVSVLGTDNDRVICELTDPPLSSIRLDTEGIGYLAAETLEHLMEGKDSAPRKRFVPASGVEVRQSTDVLAVEDREVAAALRFIREHACRPVTVEDVVARVAVSRRKLERRFRKHLQRSPNEEILRVRIKRIEELLAGTDLPLKAIADMTGFAYPEYLSSVFRKAAGVTPSRYRELHRGDGEITFPGIAVGAVAGQGG